MFLGAADVGMRHAHKPSMGCFNPAEKQNAMLKSDIWHASPHRESAQPALATSLLVNQVASKLTLADKSGREHRPDRSETQRNAIVTWASPFDGIGRQTFLP